MGIAIVSDIHGNRTALEAVLADLRQTSPDLMIVANTGCAGLSYDGDHRASYLLLDGSKPAIRRVEYEVDKRRSIPPGGHFGSCMRRAIEAVNCIGAKRVRNAIRAFIPPAMTSGLPACSASQPS